MNYTPHPGARFPIGAFLLAGGASQRMGTDKALLPYSGEILLVHLAKILSEVAEDFHILAPAGRYERYGYQVLEDQRSGCGPLAGIETALTHSPFDWNLIIACDHALIDAAWLQNLARAALNSANISCIASAESKDFVHPLLAAWHKTALPIVRSALNSGKFRVKDVISKLETQILIPPDPKILANWNRPEDLLNSTGKGKANCGG